VRLDLGTALLALTWLGGWALLLRTPRLAPARPAGTVASLRVSVIVPARDEAATIGGLVAALSHQTVAPAEVLVVDDHSRDDTAKLAASGGTATVLTAPPLPDGWTGKAWACWHGASVATGDVLVFLDADTAPGPELVERLLAELTAVSGLVSVAPYHRMRRPFERASAFFHVIAFMGIGAGSARPGAPVTGAFGPCLACRTRDYQAVGGHEAVRASVVDDVALARRFRASQRSVRVVGGLDAVAYRLYPRGIRELVDGWSKNFAAGAASTPWLRFLLVMAWVIGCGTAAQVPVRAGLSALAGWSYPGVVGWLVYAAFSAQLAVMLRPLGNYRGAALLFPLPLAVWFVVFARSIAWTIRGHATWKGRRVPVRPTLHP